MKSKIKNLFKRTVSGALAAAIGMTTLATGASAASTGVAIGYMWNSAVNPTMYTSKYAASGGKGSLRYGEQICRFVPSTDSNNWVFCVEPGASMQGSASGTWYTQYGFTEYDYYTGVERNLALDAFPSEAELVSRCVQEGHLTPAEVQVRETPGVHVLPDCREDAIAALIDELEKALV